MKILLSAYACEPNKGSEPGVGWNWALALREIGHEVHVLTRSNNRQSIEQSSERPSSRFTFHYFDLPQWLRFWKYWPGGIYLYYLLWQIGAYNVAKKLHEDERFTLVQHITFVSYRQPSFMGNLGIPFIFGPVGGGEAMPAQFRQSLPLRGRLSEWIRSVGNRLVGFDPLMLLTYSSAHVIACATEETFRGIPARFRSKCIVQRAIGISESDDPALSEIEDEGASSKPQFLFVGRLLYWKGLHLLLRALEQMRNQIPAARLRIVGEGNDGDWLKQMAKCSRVDDMVEWVDRIPHNEMPREYQNSIAFIFPSLHDSGGMVVLEALSAGLPVICLDLGGPGSIVDSSCGFSLDVSQKTESATIDDLAAAMRRISTEHIMRGVLSKGAKKRASELTWNHAARALYSHLSLLENKDRQVLV